MKFPYGIHDFKQIVTKGLVYCDRTNRIPILEETGKSLLFLRPRRFGKSLLLSMLENYYDLALEDKFEEIFGHLLIGKNPTDLHNKYFILKFDFSCIDPTGSADDVKQSMYDHINGSIKEFVLYYQDYFLPEIEINEKNALSSIKSLITSVRMTPYPVYLLIDEYDNFANEVMIGIKNEIKSEKDSYEALVHEKGPLKTFFKVIKALSGESLFGRTFITGVSPVVLSDITSGYNIAKNIYLDPEFNDLCGFTKEEVKELIAQVAKKCGLDNKQANEAFRMMKSYYNGYAFSYDKKADIYNPTLAIYFLEELYRRCKYPREMLDSNLAADEAKLRYVSSITKGRQFLLDLVKDDNSTAISKLEKRFGINEMLSAKSKDFTFIASFLYYFGVLTIAGETSDGDIMLKTPNLVTQKLYISRIRKMLLPEPDIRDDGLFAAKKLYQKGNIKPVCEFVERKFFKVFSNRDYRWANELTLKTAFLTLLYNDILYIMDSESEQDRRYTDLTMIIRPDMRKFEIFDVLLEFKFVTLDEAGLTGEEAKKLSRQKLEKLPQIQSKMKDARKRLKDYGDAMEAKYKNLRLKRFAVVSLGFERVVWN